MTDRLIHCECGCMVLHGVIVRDFICSQAIKSLKTSLWADSSSDWASVLFLVEVWISFSLKKIL
uniref:Uncharacterized protein n=1 Tax=Picea sitchensis TaxID=3332 RepID=C0PSC3_PICSI|nr:unknown [Picea sitchensis]